MPVDEPMVAMPLLLLLHVPPAVPSVNVILKFTQTPDGPVMATGNGLTVNGVVAIQPVARV